MLCWLTVGSAALGNMFVGPTPEYGASSFLVAPWWAVTEGITGVVTPLIILASVASLIVRFVRGTETVRQQVLWLVVAVILVILINAPIWFAIPTGHNILLLLSFPADPGSGHHRGAAAWPVRRTHRCIAAGRLCPSHRGRDRGLCRAGCGA